MPSQAKVGPADITTQLKRLSAPQRLALGKAIATLQDAPEDWNLDPALLPTAQNEAISELKETVDKLKDDVSALLDRLDDLRGELDTAHEQILELEQNQITHSAPKSRAKRVRMNDAAPHPSNSDAANDTAPRLAKKRKTALDDTEKEIRERLLHGWTHTESKRTLASTISNLIGFDKHENDGKMPGRGKHEPEAEEGTPAFMLPDWAKTWREDENYQIVDKTIKLVQSMHKPNSPLVPEGKEAWVSYNNLSDILHSHWGQMKKQFDTENDSKKKQQQHKWALEGRLTERRNTGAELVAAEKGITDIDQFVADTLHESWMPEERAWDDEPDLEKNTAWWEEMSQSDDLSRVQKKDHTSAWELKRPAWMSRPYFQFLSSLVRRKELAELETPSSRRGKKSAPTPRIDLGNVSNLLPNPHFPPFEFMIDPAWKQSEMSKHPTFKFLKKLPASITAEVAAELQELNGPWVHPDCYDEINEDESSE
ncbi:hypothetical protein CALCODRAFT_532866 [Calocera cornea HHB12733]|uniref:Uncharacterized protein n=1 Tax=Calocera cornea HHB12733 TaxID=1353952 RepID=A0A165CYH9_9BASI|nr:hypothetical protein CALCODRAFT_532866 [Calocera cornea HHB12733]